MSGKPGARSSCLTVTVATPPENAPVSESGCGLTSAISCPFHSVRKAPWLSIPRMKLAPSSARVPASMLGSSVAIGITIRSSGPSVDRLVTVMRNVISPSSSFAMMTVVRSGAGPASPAVSAKLALPAAFVAPGTESAAKSSTARRTPGRIAGSRTSPRSGCRTWVCSVGRKCYDHRRADGLRGAGGGLDISEELLHVLAVERLLLEQRSREPLERSAVQLDQPYGLEVGTVRESRLLVVAKPLGLLRERVVVGAHRPRGSEVGHAPLEHHRASDLRCLLEIAGGTVGDAAEDDLLGSAPRQRDLHHVHELFFRGHVAILGGEVERVPEGGSTGDDRHLLHRCDLAHQVGHERVAGFVVGENAALLLGQHLPLLEPRDDPLEGAVEVHRGDVLRFAASSEDRRLVGDVGQVGARQA